MPLYAPNPQPFGGDLKNWNEYKFRCHSLSKLIDSAYKKMTKPALTELQSRDFLNLESKERTAKQEEKYNYYLEKIKNQGNIIDLPMSSMYEIWNQETFSIKPVLKAKQVRRGIAQEQDSIDLINEVLKSKFIKNDKRFTSDRLTGEPDIVVSHKDYVIDVKTCQDWQSFQSKTVKTATEDYFWQLWAYTQLTGKKVAWIAYTCPSYPDEFIEWEKAKCVTAEEENQMWLNYNYDRIPKDKRVKMFKVDVQGVDTDLVNRILDAAINTLFNLNQNYQNHKILN